MKFEAKDRLAVFHYGSDGVIVKEHIHNSPQDIRRCLMMGYAVEQPNDQIVLPDFSRVPMHYLMMEQEDMVKRGVTMDNPMAFSRRMRGI